jgi:DNA polymerase-3 subunit alpha
MKAEEDRFVDGAVAKGYTKKLAQEIYALIEPFAGYAFNKAHAVSYGTIAYQTAYLKANYPEEYMTAVLMMAGGQQRVAEAYAECVRLGIPLLPPDVNRSDANFALEDTPSGKAVRFGLACIKNAGEGMAEGVAEERVTNGPFSRLEDFFERVNVRHLNKRALESLVKAGAFDNLAERASLLASLDRLISYAQGTQRQKESGQTSLFDLMSADDQPALGGPALESVREAPQQQKLAWEKELLGVYLSEHPFADAAAELRQLLTCSIAEVNAELTGRDIIIGGIITGTRLLSTKDGRSFIAAEIEDQTGGIEVTVWPETYEQTRDTWQQGNIVLVNVRIRARDDRLSVAVQKVALYGEGPIDAQSLFVEPQPSYGSGNGGWRRAGGNGNGKRERGGGPDRASPGEQASTSLSADTEESVPPSAQGPDSRFEGRVASAPTAVRERRSADPLRITIEETDDADEDHERLRALVNALRDYNGEGAVRLAIRQRDGEEVEMELPSARYCPELTQLLGEIVGPWGTVQA